MAETGYTLPQLALLYLLDDPRVTCVIPGSANVAELEANLTVATLPRLSANIDRAAPHRRSAIPVPQGQGHGRSCRCSTGGVRLSLTCYRPLPTTQLTNSRYGRARTWPGSVPRWLPPLTTSSPFTSTCSMPSGYW